ncbi:hypothetical protein SDC9_55036 [bioreactor metagenome]|uniref:Uncharacterized protein n=1 Tax=bioreactor metagenome TaxID=1076179 RepID=A0A644WY27_9ZZZZ
MTSLKLKLNDTKVCTIIEMLRCVTIDITSHEFEVMAIMELLTRVSMRLQNLHVTLSFSKPGTIRQFSLSRAEAWALSKSMHSVADEFGGAGMAMEYMVNDILQKESLNIQQYGKTCRFKAAQR